MSFQLPSVHDPESDPGPDIVLTPEQAEHVKTAVYLKVRDMPVLATTRSYARDLAGRIVDEWQKRGTVPRHSYTVCVQLVPFGIWVDEERTEARA